MTRTESFAMYDAHTQVSLLHRVVDKVGQPRPRFGDRHAMKVDFRLYGKLATCQLAHCATPDRLAMKAHALGITGLHRVDISSHTLAQRLSLICPGETRFGFRPVFGRSDTLPGTKGFRSRHLATEKVIFFFAQSSVLRLWCGVIFKYSERDASRQTSELSSQA